MLRWNRKNTTIAAVAAFALYFALAAWSKLTWTATEPVIARQNLGWRNASRLPQPPIDRPSVAPPGRVVVRLQRPFETYRPHGVSYYGLRTQQVFESVADSADNPTRSPLLLYEDDQLLGPPHSRIEDIVNLGQGRYSHSNRGLVFSASDDSDVNTNDRTYWAVLPN
jgi:hypothetical protein